MLTARSLYVKSVISVDTPGLISPESFTAARRKHTDTRTQRLESSDANQFISVSLFLITKAAAGNEPAMVNSPIARFEQLKMFKAI